MFLSYCKPKDVQRVRSAQLCQGMREALCRDAQSAGQGEQGRSAWTAPSCQSHTEGQTRRQAEAGQRARHAGGGVKAHLKFVGPVSKSVPLCTPTMRLCSQLQGKLSAL